MDLLFFLKGALLGFSIAAPVGPIGVLCIRKTLQHGRISGLVSGLGAATADAIYGAIAAFGLTFISDLIISFQMWIRLIGGIFLLYLGLKTLLAKPAKEAAAGKSSMGDFISTFFLTITNPMTIVSFAAVFAGLGVGQTGGNYDHAAMLVLGVFIGSAFCWLILSEGVTLFRHKMSQKGLQWVNRIAGIIITGFGVFALFGAFFS